MYVYSGSHVKETFANTFKTLVTGLANANDPVIFTLNVQDDEDTSIICRDSSAHEYLTFIDALNAEVSAHGVAIVVAADYRPDNTENKIFVVCDDD